MNLIFKQLQNVARDVARVLGIECPEVKVLDSASGYLRIETDENGKFVVCITNWEEPDMLISFLIRALRMIWAINRFGMVDIVDTLCFEAGYRIFIMKETVSKYSCINTEINRKVNAYIASLNIQSALFSQNSSEVSKWIYEARKGYIATDITL